MVYVVMNVSHLQGYYSCLYKLGLFKHHCPDEERPLRHAKMYDQLSLSDVPSSCTVPSCLVREGKHLIFVQTFPRSAQSVSLVNKGIWLTDKTGKTILNFETAELIYIYFISLYFIDISFDSKQHQLYMGTHIVSPNPDPSVRLKHGQLVGKHE